MTNPPYSGDPADVDRYPTEPVPPVQRPQQPWPVYGQQAPPPYGPPQQPYRTLPQPYGVPPQYAPPAPTGRSRAGLVAAVAVGVLGLVAVGVVLVFRLSTTVLDRTAVERDVAAQFEELEGVAVELDCAQEMRVRRGATYECTGTTADGEDVTLRIAVTDEARAAYTWTEP